MDAPVTVIDDDVSSVLFHVDGAVATIVLNRPEHRNALSIAANARLASLWDRIADDDDLRAVVLTGADCGTFCAGMDLKEAAAMRAASGKDILELLDDPFYERMQRVRVPIVAAMTGHFTGAGMVLAGKADLRVALAGTNGGITEARVGRGTPWAAPMTAMLPLGVLMEMVVTADPIPVERLLALGFVNAVEPTPDAVRSRAMRYARAIAANAPLSVAAGKAGLLASVALGAKAGYDASLELHRAVYASADAEEGPRAFAEKRTPRWSGR